MSHAATNWANRQKTGGPQAKCILLAIANEADSSGVAIVGIPWLAETTEQSEPTVRRWLAKMEAHGLVIRFERSGKKSEFRLPIGSAGVPRKQLLGEDDPDQSDRGYDPDHPNHIDGTHPNQIDGTHPNQIDRGTSYVRDSTPKAPCQGAVGSTYQDKEKEAAAAEQMAQRLEAFKSAYPCPTTRPGDLETLFAALSPDEAAEVTRGAVGYAIHCQRNKRRAMDPVKFVRDRGLWAEFAKLAPEPRPDRVFVEHGTTAWAAWAVQYQIVDLVGMPRPVDRQGALGAFMPAPMPPGGAALADYATSDGAPDLEHWTLVRHGTRQWWAWSQRVAKWGGGKLEPDIIKIPGETREVEINGQMQTHPVKVSGLLMPSEWPPRLTKPDETSGKTGELAHDG